MLMGTSARIITKLHDPAYPGLLFLYDPKGARRISRPRDTDRTLTTVLWIDPKGYLGEALIYEFMEMIGASTDFLREG